MTVLDRVLDEIRRAKGPVSVSTLSRRTGVDPRALDGMLATLTASGRLVEGLAPPIAEGGPGMACGGCGTTCVGLDACPFTVAAPTSLTLRSVG